MKRVLFSFLALTTVLAVLPVMSQDDFRYSLKVKEVQVTGLPGLHSYAYGQHDGKWLLIGGRRDGLHARQPFNAFPENHNNLDVFVVDVENNDLWTGSLNDLNTGMKEQLQSTNLNFYQSADTLYIIGGYSYAASAADHMTPPKMTSLIVSEVIEAVIDNRTIEPYFQQIEDDVFANTGGQMGKIGDYFYLIGGHRFDGRYNPMGNPTYTQTYKTGIQKFKIKNTHGQLSFSDYSFTEDPVHLRRRDYNLVPQIFPNKEEGYMISAGVFQINADLPFLYPVDITENGYTPITDFNQYLSHYHGAKTAIYDENANVMHNLFYGGMSQYYYENGELVQDDNVPFVSTISRVSRDADGNLKEYQMPVDMPGLKGAGSEFIPNLDAPYTDKKVLKINEVTEDSVLLGHIFGGIQTELRNPFSNNRTNQTSADASLFEVWLIKDETLSAFEIDGKTPYVLNLYPNPTHSELNIEIEGENIQRAHYFISSINGALLQNGTLEGMTGSQNKSVIQINPSISAQPLQVLIVVDDKFYINRTIMKK